MASKPESLSYSGSSWRFPRERFSNLLRHSKEIYRGHLLDVIRQEGPPCLRRRIPASAEILAHGRRGDLDTQLEEFPVNTRRSPQEVRLAHLFHQIANGSSEAWSSRTAARFTGPIAGKRPPMPAEDCIRL